ncbi:MAG: DUF418 domain-containing protein [Betaproteobacteria bacterium]|nr:MAG: DUF418 domain-containing protein [Betaproteobacteria bacterium]
MSPISLRDRDTLTPVAERGRESSGPVAETERILPMDVLRGFALLGILVMNIQLFAMVEAAHNNPTAYGDLNGANFLVWLFSHLLADQKFISIFSMLFGAGIVLMWQKAESSGARPTLLHYRRVGWLIVFGVLHAHLLWYGDILFTYGMCGLFVYLFRRKSPRTLISSALVLAAIGSLIAIGLGFWVPHWPADIQAEFIEDWQPGPQSISEELAAYRGSWIDQMSDRVPSALDTETSEFLMLYGWKASSLMLLGMALFKLGAFHAQWSRRQYLSLVGAGLLVGIPMIIFGVVQDFAKNWDIRYGLYFGAQYNYWGSYLVALGWTGLVMLWCQGSWAAALKERMAAVGRAAFSNYILQTVVCTTIFYGHGFGYFGSVPRTGQILIVFAIYAAQLVIAPLWLRHFQFGALEWLWRSLTYGKRQPFRLRLPRASWAGNPARET